MAAPPTTSEAWWARRWSRLTPTSAALVKSRALPARSPRSPITVAAQKAARVWPLGKLLVFGSRTGTPPSTTRRPLRSGRERPMTALRPALTRLDSTPATARARTARPQRSTGGRRRGAGPRAEDEQFPQRPYPGGFLCGDGDGRAG